MTTSSREDPVSAYNFQISLTDSAGGGSLLSTLTLPSAGLMPIAGFSECSGLEGTLELHEHMAGGRNDGVLRFPTRMKWTNLVLKRGLGRTNGLWNWYAGFAVGKVVRKDGVIVLQNERHDPHTVWGFRRGLPVSYKGPTLNAAQSAVAIESVEIAHEGLYLVPGASPLAAAVRSVLDAVF